MGFDSVFTEAAAAAGPTFTEFDRLPKVEFNTRPAGNLLPATGLGEPLVAPAAGDREGRVRGVVAAAELTTGTAGLGLATGVLLRMTRSLLWGAFWVAFEVPTGVPTVAGEVDD